MFEFMSGLIVAGFLISGLFFLRFWKRTRDSLFVAFALAFWLLALNQTLLVMADNPPMRSEAGSTCCGWRPSP